VTHSPRHPSPEPRHPSPGTRAPARGPGHPSPGTRAPAALAAAHAPAGPAATPAGLGAEAPKSREHRRKPVQVSEYRRGVGFGDQAEGDGGFEGGGRLVALGSRTAEALSSVVAVARGRLGEVEVRAEEGAARARRSVARDSG